MKVKQFILSPLLVIFTLFANQTAIAKAHSQKKIDQYFIAIQNQPLKLNQFLNDMPKGADLHNHLGGASLPENLLNYAYNDNLCIDHQTYVVSANANCPESNLLNEAILDPAFYRAVVSAWSMKDFVPGKETGHDHFFAAFAKYFVISETHSGEILAELTQRAALQNESYIELMVTPDSNQSGKLGEKLGWNPDFSMMRQQLLESDFNDIVTRISKTLDDDELKRREVLQCDTAQPKAGCNLKVRYLYQVLREQAPENVFAQFLAGFEAATKDSRIVGVNLVQPEDGPISMRDYKLQMQMVGYLHQLYPDVHISLHAGELNRELVGEAGLKSHIHDAIYVAHADRIGHGVDIMSETNADKLLKNMAMHHNLVEINLTSNVVILNVEGKEHPILTYLQYGVPVALSTDDEGLTRSFLTNEFERAVKTYHFTYAQLKSMVRNSLYYSFLPGKNLWLSDDYRAVTPECAKNTLGAEKVTAACRAFLTENEKAAMQWDLESRFNKFESKYK